MAQSKRERYESERRRIRELADAHEAASRGERPGTSDWPFIDHREDADALLEWADAYDNENATATPNDSDEYVGDDRWGKSRAPTTLRQWLNGVGAYARELDGSIFDGTAGELNDISQAMKDGHAAVLSERAKRNGGLSKSTINTRQTSLQKFLQHNDHRATAPPGDIHVFDKEGAKIDPADMMTEDEFHAFRRAPEHPRDLAITNLFLYTGQRNHAIRTLRVKDVNLEDGTYRLNPEVDGLKGAELVATWNPLLGSTNAIREWLNKHPTAPNPDPDAYLLTDRRDRRDRDPYSTISDDTVNTVLREAAETAAEEYPDIANKPTNAHAMRHNFVTMCKVRYDMDNDTIKRLIRHKPDSTVMETTYAHLSDEDYIKKAEEAFGLRDESDESEIFDPSPDFCDVCNEPLKRGAKACANCGMVYSPDAHQAKKQLQEGIQEAKDETDDIDEYRELDRLERLVNDHPELVDVLEAMVE